jgi:hypothetical protein
MLNLFLEQGDGIKELLGPGRASGDIDVDRDNLIHALDECVIVKHTA